MPALRAGAILALFLLMTLPLMPVQGLLIAVDSRLARHLPCWYHRRVCRLLGVRLHLEGRLAGDRPVLIVANHVSWLDIPVMSSIAPVSFIAKREVGTWPFIGWLARLQRSVFVDRNRRTAAGEQRNEIARRLAAGDHMILFPEGTTGDGNRVLPFKSALFTVAEKTVAGKPVTVQPVSIAYTRLNGLPIGFGWRAFYAWYGDMTLAPHLWQVLKLGETTVELAFHEAFSADQFQGRKALAAHCERVAGRGFAQLLAGRGAQTLLAPPRS
jgi:1-acyl-sn-glycerol-3-phosphate acyltransferase